MSEVAHTMVTGNKQMKWNPSSINLRNITNSFFYKKQEEEKNYKLGLGLRYPNINLKNYF
jgi:hypothetical protein